MSREFRDLLTKGGPFQADSEDEIEEKARGMIRGGSSSKLANRLARRADKEHRKIVSGRSNGQAKYRLDAAARYLGGRYKNNWASAIPIRGGKRGQYLVRRGKYR